MKQKYIPIIGIICMIIGAVIYMPGASKGYSSSQLLPGTILFLIGAALLIIPIVIKLIKK
jgi:hypothetical protein